MMGRRVSPDLHCPDCGRTVPYTSWYDHRLLIHNDGAKKPRFSPNGAESQAKEEVKDEVDDRPWGEQQPQVDWLESRFDTPPDPADYWFDEDPYEEEA